MHENESRVTVLGQAIEFRLREPDRRIDALKESGKKRRSHAVIATARANASAGVFQPSVCRGRPFNSAAIVLSFACVCVDKSLPFGRYCRTRPLLFSFVARCHGLRGSQKYTCTPVASVNCTCRPISFPRSHVRERRRCSGRVRIVLTNASFTSSSRRPAVRLTSITKRVCRSTSVPIADCACFPRM